MNILNESLHKTVSQDLAKDKDTVTAVTPGYADAIETGKAVETELAKRFKEQQKQTDDFVKDNHKTERKVKGTKEMKKMKLSESLFEDIEDLIESFNEEDILHKLDQFQSNITINKEDEKALKDILLKKNVSFEIDDSKKDRLKFKLKYESLQEKKPERNLFYKSTREPLADIIQQELTSGEVVYNLNKDGKYIMTWAPSLNLDEYDIGVNGDAKGDYIIAYVSSEDICKQVEAVASKYNRKSESGIDKYSSGNKYFTKIYLNDEDWDEPYFDPNVQIRPDGRKKKVA